MGVAKMSKYLENEFIELEKFERISVEKDDMDLGRDDEQESVFKKFSLETRGGRKFYHSLKDEQLIYVLKREAERLGHSPAQAEIFWVWRSYIKKRFKKWPYALKAAGLSRSSGKNGKTIQEMKNEAEQYRVLLEKLREKAEELCRIPHPQEIPELAQKFKKHTDSWNKVIADAGIDRCFFKKHAKLFKIENLDEETVENLDEVLNLAYFLGRPPLKSENPKELKENLIKRCGSFRNVLFQIGLEPVERINPFSSTKIHEKEEGKRRTHRAEIQDCYYQVLNQDVQTREDLRKLYYITETLGHIPNKKEADATLRRRLQCSCGSWANAIYQLKYIKEGHEKENDSKKDFNRCFNSVYDGFLDSLRRN